MTNLLVLMPVALGLGLLGLAAFLWSLRTGQYDDLEGAAARVLEDDEQPLQQPAVNRDRLAVDKLL
jgi:cbb3-type cytochrome oxidase maturation protein